MELVIARPFPKVETELVIARPFPKMEHMQWLDQTIFPVVPRLYPGKLHQFIPWATYSSKGIWAECCRFRPESFSGHNRFSDKFPNFCNFP